VLLAQGQVLGDEAGTPLQGRHQRADEHPEERQHGREVGMRGAEGQRRFEPAFRVG